MVTGKWSCYSFNAVHIKATNSLISSMITRDALPPSSNLPPHVAASLDHLTPNRKTVVSSTAARRQKELLGVDILTTDVNLNALEKPTEAATSAHASEGRLRSQTVPVSSPSSGMDFEALWAQTTEESEEVRLPYILNIES